MTYEEVKEQYCVPKKILDEYIAWGFCGDAQTARECWQYSDQDLKRLSTIMALYDIGFPRKDAESFMKLLPEGRVTSRVRIRMLETHRRKILDQIHVKERQISHLDLLRHKLEQE